MSQSVSSPTAPTANAAAGTINILLCGIGGQGVLTAAELLAAAAVAQGYDVKKTEVAGMAQRGGVVTSHLRLGAKVLAPAIPAGEADILLGFEAAEALRWCHQLRPGGIAVVNALKVKPPVVHQGLFDYPDDPVALIRGQGVTVHAIDARAIAEGLGTLKLMNTAVLGAVGDLLPFPGQVLRDQVVEAFRRRKPKLAEVNGQAFDAGLAAARAAIDTAAE